MPYLIDGHNLIPKIPGLSLDEMDDEARLIGLLQEFCRLQRKEAEVFFDNAPPGGMPVRSFGLLLVRFIRQGTTADDAIRKRLLKLGRAARNWTVVSSDQGVQISARGAQARVLSSEAFADLLKRTVDQAGGGADKAADQELSSGEIDEWLDLFGGSEGDA